MSHKYIYIKQILHKRILNENFHVDAAHLAFISIYLGYMFIGLFTVHVLLCTYIAYANSSVECDLYSKLNPDKLFFTQTCSLGWVSYVHI